MTLPKLLAFGFALFLAASLLYAGRRSGGYAHPDSFGSGQGPEVITFRWLPGATVHNCADVEERTELTCRKIDWVRDGRNKRRWLAVCQ